MRTPALGFMTRGISVAIIAQHDGTVTFAAYSHHTGHLFTVNVEEEHRGFAELRSLIQRASPASWARAEAGGFGWIVRTHEAAPTMERAAIPMAKPH